MKKINKTTEVKAKWDFSDFDPLRSYLFMIAVDNNDAIKDTSYLREVTWTDKEITLDTLIPDPNIYPLIFNLRTARRLNVAILNRTGDRVIDQVFELKNLKSYYPLRLAHEGNDHFLTYRFVYEY